MTEIIFKYFLLISVSLSLCNNDLMVEEESMFENGVSDCASNFLNGLPEGERNQLTNSKINSREIIAKILSGYEKTTGAFIDEISEFDYQILRRVSSPTLFIADMIKNKTLKIPAKWGEGEEVVRTLFSLVAETESSELRKDQIKLRDERYPKSEGTISRKREIERISLLSTNLRQLKAPPIGEGTGAMQI